jgi:hypothetical protein
MAATNGVCRWCGFVIDQDGDQWVTAISRGVRCKPSPTGVHERPRGRVAVLCDSECDGALCDKPLDHVGIHRSYEASVSWGTAADLSETLGRL